MADRKRGGRRKANDDESAELAKEDMAIAKHVRFNTPTKTTMYQQNEAHYFTGAKAVQALMDSKYGEKAKGEPMFPNRASAVVFLQRMLDNRMFFRARKLVPKKKEDKAITDKGEDSSAPGKSPKMDSPKPKKLTKQQKEEAEKEKEKEKERETEADEKKEEEKDEDDKKKNKKVKLEMHAIQCFNDSSDVYVWIFDPTPLYKKLIGLLMVVGTIVGCLFPLWPMWLRQVVYYLSISGIGFFGVIIGIAVLRTLLFALIWLVTMGEHKLWVLPNLLEDVDFWASFKPLYTYERASDPKSKESKKKTKKDKKSDDDDEKAEDEEPLIQEEEKKEEKREEEKGEEEAEEEEEKKSSGDVSISTGSGSDDISQSQTESDDELSPEKESGDTAAEAATTSGKPVRRRPRKADSDFVMVDK